MIYDRLKITKANCLLIRLIIHASSQARALTLFRGVQVSDGSARRHVSLPERIERISSNLQITQLRATLHMRLRARVHYISRTLIGGKDGSGPSSLLHTIGLRDQRSMWMQDDGCNVYVGSYMALNGPCFIATWTIFKNHLLELGLTQNREIIALRLFTIVDILCFIMVEDPHDYKYLEIVFGWGPSHVWFQTTLEDLWPHYMILEMTSDKPLDTLFWALTISWSRLLDCVWSGTKGPWKSYQGRTMANRSPILQ